MSTSLHRMSAGIIIGVFLPALLALCCAVGGTWFVRRGRRGRRVGDHPVCRRCDFDLFGLPDDQARCPECGGELHARGAVVRGHRVGRPAMVFTGCALLFTCLPLAAIATQEARRVNWQPLKPVAWLALEARGGDKAAWTELTRRVRLNTIDTEITQLVANALAWQKDTSRTWVPEIGDFVEAAREGQMLSDIDWQTYARQAPQPSLRWRGQVRKGDDLVGEVVFGGARAGSTSKLSIRIEKPIDTKDPLVIPPRTDRSSGYSQHSLSGGGGSTTGVYLRLDPNRTEAAPLGKRTTTIQFTAEVRDEWDAKTPVLEWTQDFSADWELVVRDAQTVEVVPDDSLEVRHAMEQAVKVKEIEVEKRPQGSRGESIDLDLSIGTLPVPLSHDVFFRAPDGREWKVTSITASRPTQYGTGGYVRDKDGRFDANRVDVILRPSPAAAQRTVDIVRMWNGQIVVKDLPVKWTESTTRPATGPATR